jgi:serine/threonine protein kinase
VAFSVIELIENGELYEYVATAGGPLPEPIVRFYFRQLLSAMHHMTTNSLVHRDLKLDNIMLDNNFNLKVIDFGFCAPLAGRTGEGLLHTILGTKMYIAPEIHAGEAYYGNEVDLFAAAVCCFALRAGCFPFDEAKPQSDKMYRLIA